MSDADFAVWVPDLLAVARRAGKRVLEIRRQGLAVETKSDLSPVTQADRVSEALIFDVLTRIAPEVPIISEERSLPPWETRRHWRDVWLVDPLDGTREFVAGRDEFTLNIAFVRDGSPELGLIHHPPSGKTTIAFRTDDLPGGWICYVQSGTARPVGMPVQKPAPDCGQRVLRVVVSRSHGAEDVRYIPDKLRRAFGEIDVRGMGSALKFCLLASDDADFYVRQAPCSEWDTAAGHAILQAVGGDVRDFSGRPLRYNQKPSVLNPGFFAFGSLLGDMAWL